MALWHLETSMLCATCQKIDFGRVLELDSATLSDNWTHGYLVASISANADATEPSDCQLCRLFNLIQHTTPYPSQEWELRAYSSLERRPTTERMRLPACLKTKDIPRLALVPSTCTHFGQLKPPISFIYCIPSGYPYEKLFLPKQTYQAIDYSPILSWIELCKTRHRTLCAPRPTKIHGLKVIDCYANTSQLKIVLAPPKNPYIALSYVWGEPKSREKNESKGSGTASVPNHQTVIDDAKEVVVQLGYRYLWVDKFCIDQNNDAEKELFVNNMDKIYSGAELTIVAAAGIDGDFGLPGVGSRQRQRHPTIQLGNLELISYLEHPHDSVMASKWATRAWTHQEALLSQRLLFFTEFETYYECHSMQCREGMSADWSSMHCKQGKIYAALSNGLFLGRASSSLSSYGTWFQGLDRYYEQVCQYTARDMKYDSDSLRAFTGIMNRFRQDKISISQLWGIPYLQSTDESLGGAEKSFLAGLLWKHCADFKSEAQRPERRHQFPSWSWCGWRGQVDFLVPSLRFYRKLTNRILEMQLGQDDDDSNNDGETLVSFSDVLGRDFSMTPEILVCRVLVLEPQSFLLRFNLGRTNKCRLCSTVRTSKDSTEPVRRKFGPRKPGHKPKIQIVRFPGMKGDVSLCKGPTILTRLPEYLQSNNIRVILLATCDAWAIKTKPMAYFLLVEPNAQDVFTRIGLLRVQGSWEHLQSKYQLVEERIKLR